MTSQQCSACCHGPADWKLSGLWSCGKSRCGGSGTVIEDPGAVAAQQLRLLARYQPEGGYKPLDRTNPTQVYDIHATVLHLLGIDHERLTYRHNGSDRRLTDAECRRRPPGTAGARDRDT